MAAQWIMREKDKRQKQNPRIETYLEILKQDNLLYKASMQCLKHLDESDKQMYAVCWAPALVEYVMWVLSEALQDKQERLYFLARDAYPMYLIAQQIVTKFNLRIEIRYLRVSRYSLRIPEYHLLGEKCLDRIFLSGIDVSLYQILKRAELNEEEMYQVEKEIHYRRPLKQNLNPKEITELKKQVLVCCREGSTNLLNMIYTHSRDAYANALGYLKQEGLLDSVRYAVVDSGWVGTIQKSIRTLLAQERPEIHIQGYYFGLYELPEERNGCTYKAFYFRPEKDIQRKVEFSNCLYEVMYSEACPMVKKYVWNMGQYEPVFSKVDNPNKENLNINHQVLLFYMENLMKLEKETDIKNWYKNDAKELVQQLYRTIMANPNKWEAQWYGSQLFSDDLADDHMRCIANDLNQTEIRNLRISTKLLIMAGVLHRELHESGWIEGTIVNAGKHIASNLRGARRAKYVTYLRQSLKAGKTKEV